MATRNTTTQPSTTLFDTLLAYANRVTAPSPSVKEPAIRRRIHILASLLLVVIVLGILGVLLSSVIAPVSDSSEQLTVTISTFLIVVVFCLSYVLSRTKYYLWGAVVSVGYLVLAVIASVAAVPDNLNTDLGYLTLAVLLGGILFSVRYTLLLIAVTTIAGILVPALHPDVTLTDAINILLFNFIMSGLIAVLVVLRERDISQIEQQATELAKAVEEAKSANMLKDEFLATMSHELRTPLNAIIGFSEVMMMGLAGQLEEKGLHTTKRIHHNSQRLLQLIDDLLDISKIEAGRIDLVNIEIAPQELLADMERTVKPQADEKKIAFIMKLDPNLPGTLVGDKQRLGQIMINLCTNAIKFTDKGSVTLALRCESDQTWCIEVKDTGIGIPLHAQEFIFDKFRQVDGTSRRAFSGAGLGLAIVRELALVMRGNVTVASKVNEGSTFTVNLPIIHPSKGGQ